ncbi:MAG TPA: hypothetical protein VE282_01835 [Gemmatimonadales bacterium]|nr:hypothetical protein [Gemmatimonadales bacterium]
MRAALLSTFVFTIALQSQIQAQVPVELQAGLGYARMFDAGGISFAAGVDRFLTPPSTRLQHAVGGSFWYAQTDIASRSGDSEARQVVGLGLRYQLALRSAGAFKPFLALPVQILHSNIPDRADLAATSLAFAIPESPSPGPVEDEAGTEWGWGTGLEAGFRVGMGGRLRGQTSVQLLYQDIYGAGSSHSAWNWHAGISYALFDG